MFSTFHRYFTSFEYNSLRVVDINTDYTFIRLVDKPNSKDSGAKFIKERLPQTNPTLDQRFPQKESEQRDPLVGSDLKQHTSHHKPPRPTTSHHDLPRATTSHHDLRQATTTYHEPPRLKNVSTRKIYLQEITQAKN